jgi:hypothetical protein
MGEEQTWSEALRGKTDAQLDAYVDELTETLPADDPTVDEVRAWLRFLRDAADANRPLDSRIEPYRPTCHPVRASAPPP